MLTNAFFCCFSIYNLTFTSNWSVKTALYKYYKTIQANLHAEGPFLFYLCQGGCFQFVCQFIYFKYWPDCHETEGCSMGQGRSHYM